MITGWPIPAESPGLPMAIELPSDAIVCLTARIFRKWNSTGAALLASLDGRLKADTSKWSRFRRPGTPKNLYIQCTSNGSPDRADLLVSGKRGNSGIILMGRCEIQVLSL
jgi:hypothetical protein